ncbi:hypothetical protein [Microbacterium sp. H1-D42]|uniref:hypothetical protein n=1 Tax=Microbacterium sp. H1-D42 TaxID=2925844 RepID=UPI001F536E9F|nr:hypothetical protein [Microbacterium sp. H1-D42]UNK70932.1 hypothetical protein MNR00_00365 [Microbacterium sp. H1-D42]
MDILDTVRDMKPDYPASAQASRRVLHREIARSKKSHQVRRVAAFSVGGAAVAAFAVAASTFAPPGAVNQPQAASASTYLNETAASIRAAGAGESTAVTITTQHLGLVGGPNTTSLPFGDIRAGATGAVVTESSSTFRGGADGEYSQTSHTELHASDVYGDEAAVESAWNAYYAETDIGAFGTLPDTMTEAVPGGAFDRDLPVSTTDFPTDPAVFLEEWTQGMKTQLAVERAKAADLVDGDPESTGIYDVIDARLGVPTASHMLNELMVSVPVQIASAEYRATFLEALALAKGIEVESADTSNKVLVYETADDSYRLTVDPEAGAIVTVEWFRLRVPTDSSAPTADDSPVAVGSAAFLPDDVPSVEVSFRSEPAN